MRTVKYVKSIEICIHQYSEYQSQCLFAFTSGFGEWPVPLLLQKTGPGLTNLCLRSTPPLRQAPHWPRFILRSDVEPLWDLLDKTNPLALAQDEHHCGNDNHVKHHCPNFKHLESFCELVRRWQKVPETTDTARLQSIKAFAANEDFLPFSTWSICLPLSSFLVLSYLSAGLGRRHGGTSSISSEFSESSESGESSSLVPKVSPGIHGRPPKVKLTLTVRADVQSYSLQIMKTNRPFCEGRCMSEIYLSMYKANTSLDVIAPSHSVEISICRLSVPGTLVAWKHSFGLSWQSSFWMFL